MLKLATSKSLLGPALLAACGAVPSLPAGENGAKGPIPVARGGPGEFRHFPFAFDVPGGATLVAYSEHPDAVVADPVDALAQLGGAVVEAPNFYLSSITEAAGVLLGVSYITQALDSGKERAYGWTSADGGATWKPRLGVVHLPEPPKPRDAGWGGLLFHRRTHALADGSIVGTLYGNYERDSSYRTVWARSADLGATWDVLSTVASGLAGTEGYAEPVSAICPDGSIVVVMRTGPASNMRWSRSADGGATWTPARELEMVGWDPDLLLTQNGLYLSYGLPGKVWVATSADCGERWASIVELDVPTTSGYTALAHDASGRLLVFTDTDGEDAIIGYYLAGP